MGIVRSDELIVYDVSDPTKRLKFNLSAIPTGSTQTNAVGATGGMTPTDAHGQATVDFADGAESATVTVSDAGVGAASRIIAIMAYAPTGSRDLDELEMDSFEVKAGNIVASTSFDILVTCLTGYAHGTFYVNYERN